MNEHDKNFRDDLIASESVNDSLQQCYKNQVQQMLERKLNVFSRVLYFITATLLLLMGLFYLVFGAGGLAKAGIPVSARVVFGALGTACIAFAAFLIWMCRKGTIKLEWQPSAITTLLWSVTILAVMGVMAKGIRINNPLWTIEAMAYACVFLVVTSMLMVMVRISQSELTTRQQLLMIEYRITDIADKLQSRKDEPKQK